VLFHRYLRELDFELRAVACAEHVVTLSEEDAARLRAFRPELSISVSPCGVDVQHFRPDAVAPAAPVDLLFVGNFGHPPNGDAVRFLVSEVLPAVAHDVRLRVVGHGAAEALRDLERSSRVEIVGPVADVRPHLASARIAVAPVRFGTGMRGKVLEALAMGRPVVTTPLGAEGLGARPGQDLLIAEGARETARAIQRLIADPALGLRIGCAGRAFVSKELTWSRIAEAHETIYTAALRAPHCPAPATSPARPFLRALASRAGHHPGVGIGMSLLVARALRWHAQRLFARPSAAARNRMLGPAAA
jgi:glycosyltransferase involved in cell wall biosynthesis